LAAQVALDSAIERGGLVISAPVFSELMACPGRTEAFIQSFLEETSIAVDWEINETIWRSAGRAFQSYAACRKQHNGIPPRRILADFVIGAHAATAGYRLLTFDDRLYHAAFPKLTIVRF
jgi:predicted nucleic acid-binding protein